MLSLKPAPTMPFLASSYEKGTEGNSGRPMAWPIAAVASCCE